MGISRIVQPNAVAVEAGPGGRTGFGGAESFAAAEASIIKEEIGLDLSKAASYKGGAEPSGLNRRTEPTRQRLSEQRRSMVGEDGQSTKGQRPTRGYFLSALLENPC